MSYAAAQAAPVPLDSLAAGFCARPHLADAFSVDLPPEATTCSETLARHVLARQPLWVAVLMKVRDALVAGFGLKTARQLQAGTAGDGARRIHIFRIYRVLPAEILLGEDDKHLDFRISVLRHDVGTASGPQPRLTVATVVHCHNLLGRTYIRLIAPFHRRVVRSSLEGAARAGWPRDPMR